MHKKTNIVIQLRRVKHVSQHQIIPVRRPRSHSTLTIAKWVADCRFCPSLGGCVELNNNISDCATPVQCLGCNARRNICEGYGRTDCIFCESSGRCMFIKEYAACLDSMCGVWPKEQCGRYGHCKWCGTTCRSSSYICECSWLTNEVYCNTQSECTWCAATRGCRTVDVCSRTTAIIVSTTLIGLCLLALGVAYVCALVAKHKRQQRERERPGHIALSDVYTPSKTDVQVSIPSQLLTGAMPNDRTPLVST